MGNVLLETYGAKFPKEFVTCHLFVQNTHINIFILVSTDCIKLVYPTMCTIYNHYAITYQVAISILIHGALNSINFDTKGLNNSIWWSMHISNNDIFIAFELNKINFNEEWFKLMIHNSLYCFKEYCTLFCICKPTPTLVQSWRCFTKILQFMYHIAHHQFLPMFLQFISMLTVDIPRIDNTHIDLNLFWWCA